MTETRLAAGYFEDLYADDPDPWGFETRWYERRKRALTMAALPQARYRDAFEPGCSIGTLTAELTGRCDRLVCTDVASKALDSAADRIARLPESAHGAVEFRRWALGDEWPDEHFDLIVLSEVCYYLDQIGLRQAFEQVAAHAEPGGTVLCVHWRHQVADYPLLGDQVHAIARATDGLAPLAQYHDADMLINVFTAGNGAPPSVAQAEHLV